MAEKNDRPAASEPPPPTDDADDDNDGAIPFRSAPRWVAVACAVIALASVYVVLFLLEMLKR